MDAATRRQARQRLAEAERADRAVRAAGRPYALFLVGLGVLSAGWFVSLGWASSTDRGVLVSAAVFGVLIAGLCIGILPRASASRRGFTTRFASTMLGWSAVFSVGLGWGLSVWRGTPAYWLAAAVCVLLPAMVGGYVEARGREAGAR